MKIDEKEYNKYIDISALIIATFNYIETLEANKTKGALKMRVNQLKSYADRNNKELFKNLDPHTIELYDELSNNIVDIIDLSLSIGILKSRLLLEQYKSGDCIEVDENNEAVKMYLKNFKK